MTLDWLRLDYVITWVKTIKSFGSKVAAAAVRKAFAYINNILFEAKIIRRVCSKNY